MKSGGSWVITVDRLLFGKGSLWVEQGYSQASRSVTTIVRDAEISFADACSATHGFGCRILLL